mgnify:FL=1|jgi:hypothetical protein|tara:strand:+ start:1255 stop:1680 length:426 start_codon:yes stop_codon:yes gene_type:complete
MSFMAFLSIAGAVKQYSDADKAASNMREAGEKNAQLAELETQERIRRSRYQYDQEQGQRVVAYAKSGVDLSSGSSLAVMAEAANVAEREISFTAEQGKRTASARRAGASAQADSMSSQGQSLLISSVGKVGNDNNWWGIGQ